jgi:hypothetical protein
MSNYNNIYLTTTRSRKKKMIIRLKMFDYSLLLKNILHFFSSKYIQKMYYSTCINKNVQLETNI